MTDYKEYEPLARQAYSIWRDANPRAKVNNQKAPTVDEFFTNPEYIPRAYEWLQAAQRNGLIATGKEVRKGVIEYTRVDIEQQP